MIDKRNDIKKKAYIFGAHSRGRTMKEYLSSLCPNLEIEAFLVNNGEKNENVINDVPVINIDDSSIEIDVSAKVYLAVRGVYHSAVDKYLRNLGFTDIIPVTPSLDCELRNEYVKNFFERKKFKFNKLSIQSKECNERKEADLARIFVICSAFDSKVSSEYVNRPYEYKLQVGCKLTDIRIGDYFDDEGISISDRNKQYCELTGLYWLWKNISDDVVGVCHYRRHFILPQNWESLVRSDNVDAVLPVPLYVSPTVKDNYCERHVKKIWDDMIDIIKEKHSEMLEDALNLFGEGLYTPCNMLIAKKSIYDELCGWLFSIVDELVEKNGQLCDEYQNRYPGFIAERLITLFFFHNRERFKIYFADKNFLM